VKASGRPQDSYGVALGLRGNYLKKWGIDFDLVSPFVAYVSTREVPENSELLPSNEVRHGSVVAGLSLNLDTALSWLKNE
jgi:hypothetical protein